MKKLFQFKNILAVLIVAVMVNGYLVPVAKACYQGDLACTGSCTPDGLGFKMPVGSSTTFSTSFANIAATATATTGPGHTITFSGGTVSGATLSGISTTGGESSAGLSITNTGTVVTVLYTGGNTSGTIFYTINFVYLAPGTTGSETVINHLRTNETPVAFDSFTTQTITINPLNAPPVITPTVLGADTSGPFGHTHGVPIPRPTQSLNIKTPESGQTSTLSNTCTAAPFGVAPPSGGDDYTTILTYTQAAAHVTNQTCLLTATDNLGAATTVSYTVFITQVPTTLTPPQTQLPPAGGPATLIINDSDDLTFPAVLTVSGVPPGAGGIFNGPAPCPLAGGTCSLSYPAITFPAGTQATINFTGSGAHGESLSAYITNIEGSSGDKITLEQHERACPTGTTCVSKPPPPPEKRICFEVAYDSTGPIDDARREVDPPIAPAQGEPSSPSPTGLAPTNESTAQNDAASSVNVNSGFPG